MPCLGVKMTTKRKLITIITELSLENTLTRELENFTISGYTITDVRGKGSKGEREGGWDASRNIRIEVVCDSEVAQAINTMLQEKYYECKFLKHLNKLQSPSLNSLIYYQRYVFCKQYQY